jgi:hypothetical protein
MTPIVFTCRGKRYQSFIEASTTEYPYFYWFSLEDPELIGQLGDCLSFQLTEDGVVQPWESYPEAYKDLVNQAQGFIEQFLQSNLPLRVR